MAKHGDTGGTPVGDALEPHEAPRASAGTAVIAADAIPNPGLPAHRHRVTDTDPKAERRASRQVTLLFWISMAASIFAIVAYFVWPIDTTAANHIETVRLNNMFVGLGIGLALFAIGIGAVHWAKQLMVDEELVDERHPLRTDDEGRQKALDIIELGNKESGFGRRALIRNSLIGAAALSPLPAVVLFRDLAPADDPHELMRHTLWEEGSYLALDPSGARIKASDVTLGSAFHVIPEKLNELHGVEKLNEKAKAIVLMVRLKPEDLTEAEDRKDWSYNGIVAYSKVCTHVGCPVALYEQQTHHLLCPCHQSTFDISDGSKVVFGPAKRPLPQLPITVDSEGYLVARSDFTEPVGPSYWERLR